MVTVYEGTHVNNELVAYLHVYKWHTCSVIVIMSTIFINLKSLLASIYYHDSAFYILYSIFYILLGYQSYVLGPYNIEYSF